MKKTIGIIALALFVGASLTYACGCGCKDKKAKLTHIWLIWLHITKCGLLNLLIFIWNFLNF